MTDGCSVVLTVYLAHQFLIPPSSVVCTTLWTLRLPHHQVFGPASLYFPPAETQSR